MTYPIAEHTYNPKTRAWEVERDGTTLSFPAGPQGKLQAQLAALPAPIAAEADALLKAALARGIESTIVPRIVRAAFIVAKAQVYHGRPPAHRFAFVNEIARVQSSQYDWKTYPVCQTEHGYYCDCPDWRAGRARALMAPDAPERPEHGAPAAGAMGYACKHVLAWYIAGRLADYETPDEPIPFNGEPGDGTDEPF